MKTVWLNAEGVVTQISLGEPNGDPPEGIRWVVVEDGVNVGIGYVAGSGGTFDPPPPPPAPAKEPVKSVSMAQARIALSRSNLLNRIENGISLLPEPQQTEVRTAWEYSTTVNRDGVLVNTLASTFGFTDAQLDTLFEAASAIQL